MENLRSKFPTFNDFKHLRTLSPVQRVSGKKSKHSGISFLEDNLTPPEREVKMNELIDESLVTIRDGKYWTTSLKIAEKFEKEHRSVIKAIEESSCSKEFRSANFHADVYKDSYGREQPMYYLTQQGFSWVVLGFTGEKASMWKEKFLITFEKLMNRALSLNFSAELEEFKEDPKRVFSTTAKNAKIMA